MEIERAVVARTKSSESLLGGELGEPGDKARGVLKKGRERDDA